MTRLLKAVSLLAVPAASAWNDCEFPAVDYFAIDEGVGISYTYALAAMNGNMYSGGYTKGNFAFVGVKKTEDVNPEACQSLWGTTTSDIQNLYIAEVSAAGKMTKGWHFKGSVIQQGEIGHGPQTNAINAHSGMHKMMDNKHIAVTGGFKGELTLPNGVKWSSAGPEHDGAKLTSSNVPFVMKLDVSSTQGVGQGTTGWAKMMDIGYPGGVSVASVDGDASGNMIAAFQGCASYDPAATGYDAYGRPTVGAAAGCTDYITKLAASDGAEVWKKTVPVTMSSCRVVQDGSFFCAATVRAGSNLDFGNGVTLTGTGTNIAVVKFSTDGLALWAKETMAGSYTDLSVNMDGTLLAVAGNPTTRGAAAFVARIDTSAGNEGNVLWSDNGGVGTHGFRGIEVTADPTSKQEVTAFGQIAGSATLSDTGGATTTLNSRGSYEAFVVAYDAADGTGKYAMDGGGTGMEYFFAFARDAGTNDVYVGGTSRSEKITWGNVERTNVMYNGDKDMNNPKTTTPVGSSKAFVVKLKSQTELPDCLNTCDPSRKMVGSDVKTGHCYIDRYCYAHEAAATYDGAACYKCDASSSPLAWSGPNNIGTSHCFIGNECVAAGAHKQIRSGRSTVDSECETCQPSVAGNSYTVTDGYMMDAQNLCHKKTWAEEAAAAGWTAPTCTTGPWRSQGRARRRARALAQLADDD